MGDHATHCSNPWHHPWCRQGRREDRGSMACFLEPKEVGTQLVPPSQIAMDRVGTATSNCAGFRCMALDMEPEKGTAHFHRDALHVQTTPPPPTKPRRLLCGVACFIHATKPRLGTASSRDLLGQGHCVAQQSLQCGYGRSVPSCSRTPTHCEQTQARPTSAKMQATLRSTGTRVSVSVSVCVARG